MSKNNGLTFTIFAALGAIAGYATYMASKDEFSEETVNRYDTVVNKVKNVGADIKRTYISIGDKDEFASSTEKLRKSTKNLAANTGELVKSATSDIYNHAKENIKKSLHNLNAESTTHAKKSKKSTATSSNKTKKKGTKKNK